jgi:beta-lactamase regulating signal transducer with metallopeptidase domain
MTFGVLFSLAAHVLALVWAVGIWQGALFVGLATLLPRLMPRASATVRHNGLIILFALSMGIPGLSLLHPAAPAHPIHGLQISMGVAIAIAGFWAAATLYRTISLMIAWQYLRDVRRSALPAKYNLEALDIDISRRPMVCMSAFVDTPVIVGFSHPVLLLPEWLTPTLSTEEFRQIALHECEHLRRRDDWTNLWLQIGMTLFPLNPALRWLNRRIAAQRELACDAAVVATTARPTEYAASLVNIASQRRFANTLRLALAAWGRQSEISQRVHALLEQPPSGTRTQRIAGTGPSICLVIASVVGLAFAPQFVTLKVPLRVTLAANQNDASIENVVEARPSHAAPSAVHFVATSYDAPPVANVQPDAKPKVSLTRKHRIRPTLSAADPPYAVEALSRRIARPSEAEFQDLRVVDVQYEAPVRAVPVLFVPTYLAVPVSGGWIMIQL